MRYQKVRTMTNPILSLKNINKSYITENGISSVIEDLSMDVFKGEILALIGRSGSGKTTLLNIIGCLDDMTHGKYYINGVDVSSLDSDSKSHLRGLFFGFIFQKYNLLKDFTAIENVCIPASYLGTPLRLRETKALEIFYTLGLKNKINASPSQLSGGQQQRVSIARALINDAEVILADEPTGALDNKSAHEVISELKRLNQVGKTIIIVTHDNSIANHAHRIIEIDEGKIKSIKRIKQIAEIKNDENPLKEISFTSKIKFVDLFKNSLSFALKSINGNRSRTLLTILGIIIGITSVALVSALGEGAKNKVMKDINSFGNYSLEIYPGNSWDDHSPGAGESLKNNDIDQLASLNYIQWLSPVMYSSNTVKFTNNEVKVNVVGVGSDFIKMQPLSLIQGSFFSVHDISNFAQSVIIDSQLSEALFKKNNPIGQIILVGVIPCTVIGVVKLQANNFLQNASPTVWLPYSSVMYRFDNKKHFDAIKIQLHDFNSSIDKERLAEFLERIHGKKDFFIIDSADSRNILEKVYFTLSLMISSIALVSLVVGGIGVMNIMVVAVSERKKDISILMALGARQRDIFLQFLSEAMIITFLGCIIGIVMAEFLCLVINLTQNDIYISISINSIILSVAVSIAVGLIFGLYPAKRAAKLNPVFHLSNE